jgi:hypothetical protein
MSPKNPVRVPSDDEILRGHDIRSLGPSDSSDTGADMMGIEGLDSTSDRQGTGERQSIEGLPGEDLDLRPNRVVSARDAGLGGGLDQAEEAQFGVTDEEIQEEFAPDDDE